MDRRSSSQTVEELVAKAQKGDNAAVEMVLRLFDTDIRKIAHSGRWFMPGADPEDIEQEARIGLYNAIFEYNPKRSKINFEAFALKVCVKRAIITAINRENRRRMDPLNHGVSLSTPTGTGEGDADQTLEEFIPDQDYDLEELVVDGVEFSALDGHLREVLTNLEMRSYELYKDGHSYREIAAELEETEKTVDNALMRVRNKAKRVVARHIVDHSLDEDNGASLERRIKQWGLRLDGEDPEMFWPGIIDDIMRERSVPEDEPEAEDELDDRS